MTKKIHFMETVLRDGHQSLVATRMSTPEMLPILKKMDEAGYDALEVWGGATFDACLRYLNEDPWERLRTLKRYFKKTPFSMLLRAQNLVGYRNYADDVATAVLDVLAGMHDRPRPGLADGDRLHDSTSGHATLLSASRWTAGRLRASGWPRCWRPASRSQNASTWLSSATSSPARR